MHLLPKYCDGSLVPSGDHREYIEQGSLACTVRTDHTHDLTFTKFKTYICQGLFLIRLIDSFEIRMYKYLTDYNLIF